MPSRRQFLKSSAATVAASAFAAPAFVRGQNLNSKLQLAAIGCGGKGLSDIREVGSHPKAQFIALCDVDLGRTKDAEKLHPEAEVIQDYREMFSRLGDKIDAVTISTPDHMHAIIGLQAMGLGKHVYCQKPLTHTVDEARRMAKAAQGLITRLGNQIHSHTYYRTVVRDIQAGVIGPVKRVHSWCNATGHGKSGFIDRPKNPIEPPKTVNWDQWVGVAPMRPYGVDRCYHPWGWRDWQDFGNGALGDFACHILDPVFTALEINKAPLKFTADHSGMNDEVWPAQTQVEYHFAGTSRTGDSPIRITWYDGGRLPSTNGSHLPPEVGLPRSGSLFIGELGSLVLPHVGKQRLYMKDGATAPESEPAEDLNHYHGWVDGCLSGKQPSDGFEYGALLTETALLGNIAVRYRGETLEWDAEGFRLSGPDGANRWLTREYREGWELPS